MTVADAAAAPAEDDDDLDTLIARARRLETVVLERPGGRDAVYGGLCILMVGAAVWLLMTGALAGDAVWMSAASGVFFAVLGGLLVYRWLNPDARRLTLSPDGFAMATLFAHYRLPWPHLSDFRVVPAVSLLPGRGDGAMIVFAISPKPDASVRRDVLGVPVLPIGSRGGLGPGYGFAHGDLIRLIEAYRDTVLHDRPSPASD